MGTTVGGTASRLAGAANADGGNPRARPARRAPGFAYLDTFAPSSGCQALGPPGLSIHDFSKQGAVMTQA